ncbi:MAG: adenosylcobinamide-GDP ribazoletransferase [Nitrospiraceae bacterium]|nr:MAG: adenosylcobinamide-GDP ribazoletransferase [Nitrospiraceae bacterium]
MKQIILAFQFLTVFPVQDQGVLSGEEVGRAAAWFPLVGLIEGLILGISAKGLLSLFPVEVVNALLVLLIALMNGGLHLDGLADTADAVASRAGRERKLAIMKEGSVGPAGVIAIVITLLLKYALLNALFRDVSQGAHAGAILAMPVLSRWAMVPAAFYGEPARQDGLGKMVIDHTGKGQLITATAAAFVLLGAAAALQGGMHLMAFYAMFVMPLLYAFSFGAARFCRKAFGGLTGDTFGAVNEISALVFLLMVLINNAAV